MSFSAELLLERSFEFFNEYSRDPQQTYGQYLDIVRLSSSVTDWQVISNAVNGFGLMSLCIGAEKGYITQSQAKQDALLTLRTIAGQDDSFQIDKSANGYFAHWFERDSGELAGSEYSTIDTGLMVLGAIFAKNYFDDAEIAELVDEIAVSIDWADSIAHEDANGKGWLYMLMGEDGTPDSVTANFNEYYLLNYVGAYTEYVIQGIDDGEMYLRFLEQYDTPPSYNRQTRIYYEDYDLLTDNGDTWGGGSYLSDFIMQFCMYTSAHFQQNEEYMQFAENQAQADRLYWQNSYPDSNSDGIYWGLGAGSGPNGYDVGKLQSDSIPDLYAPHIVAGWLPLMEDEALASLEYWWDNDANSKVLMSDDGEETRYILWKAGDMSADTTYSEHTPTSVNMVDFSSMINGLAAHSLGMEFFANNAANFEDRDKVYGRGTLQKMINNVFVLDLMFGWIFNLF